MFELALSEGGQAVPLGDAPLHVGRGPANHLVLQDDTVSWNHAQVWMEAGRAWVRDLGSRNGTFRNGEPCAAATPLEPGDRLRFGKRVEVVLRAPLGFEPVVSFKVRQLQEVATGHVFMLRSNRFHIGSGADAHLRIQGAPARAATLMIHDDEIWVGTDDEEFQVEIGETFDVAGRSMRIVEARLEHVPTVEHGEVEYGYTCRCVANGPLGPEAWLEAPSQGLKHHVTGNGAILLLLLARTLERDRAERLDDDEQGWMSDADVRTGIWGRGGGTKSALNVLVHRLRKQLETDGFDPWFIEKKRRGIRARLTSVDLQ
ncbi:MAG: FHA domain-containing protein [Alphaproteobacteria bacterium]|nr:FHA domain-containing protein [Alphaproteobacteria bacterium]